MKSIKLLCVAILGVVVGGAECAVAQRIPPLPQPAANPVLDLPNETPGLHMVAGGTQPVLITKEVNNQNVSCLHVIVPGTEAAANGINARNFRGNIYFPKNGTQPTTPEAVEYSCANIDNTPDSPITEWYMRIFGVIPFRNTEDPANDYIKAGYDQNNNPCRIISYDFETMGTDEGYEDSYHIHHDTQREEAKRQTFITNFRKIASTSVGRVLLYRILIEIRRHNPEAHIGCTERPDLSSDIPIAPRCRCLCVIYHNSFYFIEQYPQYSAGGALLISDSGNPVWNDLKAKFVVIGDSLGNYTNIVQCPIEDDVALFHEMVHWFYQLRAPLRQADETNALGLVAWTHSIIARYYWRNFNMVNTSTIYKNIWRSFGLNEHVNFDEMRTILGLPYVASDIFTTNYLHGDYLCENLYRVNIGAPLRFGYRDVEFYESAEVTERVIAACLLNYYVYSSGTKFQRGAGSVPWQYTKGEIAYGNSSARVFKKNND